MHVEIGPLRPHIQRLITLFNIPSINQVSVFAFICKDLVPVVNWDFSEQYFESLALEP